MFPVGSMPMLQNGGVHEAGHFSREHNLPWQKQPGQAKATRDRMGAAVPRRLVVVAALRSETPALWDMGWREGTFKNMLVFQELQLPRSIA